MPQNLTSLSTRAMSSLLLMVVASIKLTEGTGSLRGLATGSTCSTDLQTSCNFVSCRAWRGPTTCAGSFWKRCQCKPGYCAENGKCRLSVSSLKANVASVTASHPTFPAPHDQVSTAVCISGGGSRSMSLAMGQLRALESLGFMSKIDALSSVSGGTWASSVYMFANMSKDELLGTSASPATLTMDVLRQTPPALGATVVGSNTLWTVASLKADGVLLDRLWQEAISKIILEPFGLGDKDRFMAASSAAVEAIVSRNPDLASYSFLTPVADRPKVFIMGGTLLAPSGEKVNNNSVSFQMSPDYVGSPFYPNGQRVSYQQTQDIVVGGGLVETFAFGGEAPNPQSGGEQVSVPSPKLPFTLSDAVGISSAAFAALFSNYTSTLSALNPTATYWPVTQPGESQAPLEFQVGDGANIENTGVLEALQRGARKILWFANTEDPLVSRDSFDFCDISVGATLDPHGKIGNEISNKFGYGLKHYVVDAVFADSDLAPMACDLQKLVEAGQPAVVHRSMQLLPNTWWGISGGYNVDLVLVYNEVSTAFQAELPMDTQAELAKGSRGAFKKFPQLATIGPNSILQPLELTAEQVNLLAAYGEYAVRQNQDIIDAVLRGHDRLLMSKTIV